ncbi:MAG TPA: DNA mismatch repair endonuclease MutL [Eubacteriales bacterium]|nr:DNA mismatch repair endonuclease MutL [Eubacteriales bacterium]
MARVHVLPPHIANQIAAGEVVDRPSSVVKELVENAIDAGATAVTIEVENGGTDLIRVTDNGSGIADEDCETAFLRHATSKIAGAGDLFSIRSLGFRGEALASIAAVSRVELQTRTEEDELGTLIRYEGGKLVEHKRCGGTRGTSITVKNLFYNVPARLKFMKSARAESASIGDYAARLILSAPQIAVHFVNNGRTVYLSEGNGALRDALLSVYGVSVDANLCPLTFDDGYLKIEGFVGTPEIARSNRTGQTITLNGRIIRAASLSNALSRAFDTRLMGGKFPFAVVSLSISFAEVDVNVHPAKLEVRFTDEQRVARSLVAACSEALIRSYIPSMESEPAPSANPASFPDAAFAGGIELRTGEIRPNTPLRENADAYPPQKAPSFHFPRGGGESREAPSLWQPQTMRQESEPLGEPYFIIGAAFDAYWFVQQGDSVFIIDQHAAHERLLYDALMEKRAAVVSQTLFLPEDVRLLPTEAELFTEHRAALEAFGFVFSDATETSVTLLAVPQVNGAALKSDFLHEALERLGENADANKNEWFRDALAQSACKHAVKAGERLTREEISRLLEALKQQDTLLTCPHGRPIAVRLTKLEIEKLFKRVL